VQKDLTKYDKKTTQNTHNFTCIFSNNFKHAKGHKKQVLITQNKCKRNHKVFYKFLTNFLTKKMKTRIELTKKYFRVFSSRFICKTHQNLMKISRKY
jgi:hypothetical protein